MASCGTEFWRVVFPEQVAITRGEVVIMTGDNAGGAARRNSVQLVFMSRASQTI